MSSYIDHRDFPTGLIEHSWQAYTLDRIEWLYGPERAAAVMAGADRATNADLDAWNRIGRKAVAA